MEILKLLNPQMMLAQVVCFFLVLVLLKKFLWKPVFNALEDRRARVLAELKAVEDAKADVAKLKSDYAASLARIDEKAQERLQEITQIGEVKTREMRELARQDAERIIEDARKEIGFDIIKARETLRSEMVSMIVEVTEKMIEEKLTFDQDKKLIEGMLTEMDKADAK